MLHIKRYKEWLINESNSNGDNSVSNYFILDGASSSGKSAISKRFKKDICILSVDSFYNVMFEAIGKEDFGNSKKLKITEIYPDCPFKWTSPQDPSTGEKAARWYMAKESKEGKIKKEGLVDANGNKFGLDKSCGTIVYDDVEGTAIQIHKRNDINLPSPKWILIHAPIDHTIKNVKRRGDRGLESVLMNAYCYKYKAVDRKTGPDPDKSWTKDEIIDLINEDWAKEFVSKLGIKGDKEYWIDVKDPKSGNYHDIINTRDSNGNQKSISELVSETEKIIN